MAIILKIPREVEKVLGADASDKLHEFLNTLAEEQKKEVLELSDDKFGHRLSEIRVEIAEFKGDVQTKFSEVRTEFAVVRKEMAEFKADLKSDIADIHKQIANQTKWILVAVLGAVVLLPSIERMLRWLWP